PDLVDPPSILRPICSTETRPIETYTLSLHDALPISAGTSARLLVPEAAIERIIEAGTLPIRAKALGEDARRACRSDPDPVPGTAISAYRTRPCERDQRGLARSGLYAPGRGASRSCSSASCRGRDECRSTRPYRSPA